MATLTVHSFGLWGPESWTPVPQLMNWITGFKILDESPTTLLFPLEPPLHPAQRECDA